MASLSHPILPWSTPETPEELREAANRDGAVLLRGLLPEDVVACLHDRVLAALEAIGWHDGQRVTLTETPAYQDPVFVRLQQRVLPAPAFEAVRRHHALLDVMRQLFGGPVLAERGDLVRIVPPGGEPTPAHQDQFYLREPRLVWTAWLPLAPTPIEQGPLAIWPGTHRDGALPHHGPAEDRRTVSVPAGASLLASDLMPGDVIVHHSYVVHLALPNKSEKARLSADFRYIAEPGRVT